MSAEQRTSVRQATLALWSVGVPWQPAVIGHAFAGDTDGPIFTSGERLALGTAVPPVDCGGCASRLQVAAGDDVTMLLVEHDRGCRAMAAWARGAR